MTELRDINNISLHHASMTMPSICVQLQSQVSKSDLRDKTRRGVGGGAGGGDGGGYCLVTHSRIHSLLYVTVLSLTHASTLCSMSFPEIERRDMLEWSERKGGRRGGGNVLSI